jgi:hypothetical protein
MATKLSVKELSQIWNPIEENVWDYKKPITRWEVRREIRLSHFVSNSYSDDFDGEWTRIKHIRRIAWLVVNGWKDPIRIRYLKHLGIHVHDGNHRLAASLIRKDSYIMANVLGNSNRFSFLEYKDF